MEISLVVAAAENNAIGYENDLPWGRGLPADLEHFKKTTSGHTVIMGRKTFESIGRLLPNRTNIIISRDQNYDASGGIVVTSLEQALSYARSRDEKEIFIIGGAQIFERSLPLATKIYLTRVHADVPGDTFFSGLNPNQWQKVSEEKHLKDEKNIYDYTFEMWERAK